MPINRIYALIAILSCVLAGCDSKKKTNLLDSYDTSVESPVTYHDGDDPEIAEASRRARESFKYFWKEASLDFNRVIPAVEIATVKVPFNDGPKDPESTIEHMWLIDLDFDGEVIRGVLMNSPNKLKSVKAGDTVEVKVNEITDWICVSSGEVYGGYTVQVARKRMGEAERNEFDTAWGLDFPPPGEVVLPPNPSPFEAVLARKLEADLGRNAKLLSYQDDDGRTLLHRNALYGQSLLVEVLIKAGADPTIKCNRGWTAVDYARAAQWENIVEQLKEE